MAKVQLFNMEDKRRMVKNGQRDLLCLTELSQTKAIIQIPHEVGLLALSPFTCSWEIVIIERDTSPFTTLKGDMSHYCKLTLG